VAQYVASDGMHRAPTPDVTQTISVLQPLQFNPPPQCNNDLRAGWGNQVEVGHPIRCMVSVQNPATGAAAANVDVTWSVTAGSGTGVPLLSCATSGHQSLFASTIWNTAPGNPCVPGSTLHCVTGASGQCSVIYRRLRQLSGSAPLTGGSQGLTVSVLGGAISLPLPGGITVTSSIAPHPAMTWFVCTPVSRNVQVEAPAPFSVRMATFQSTAKIEVHGASGIIACAPTVIDEDPSPALDCSAGPPPSCTSLYPDQQDAHAPVGSLNWQLGGAQFGAPACTLTRLDWLPPQAPNETPYAASCPAATFTVSGTVGQETTLAAVMTGSGSQPSHVNAYSVAAEVEFKP
jgi:hypothetical protein